MVTFSCGTCNESLKKQKVEQHWFRCKNDYVTCIDCNGDFYGDEFNAHVKCVSEAERYGGVNFKGKANKGEAKQNSWIESIQNAMESSSLSHNAKRVFDVIGANENIPRKKKKFDNFVKNTCRFAFQGVIDEVWAAINVKKEVQKEDETKEKDTKENNDTQSNTGKSDEVQVEVQAEVKSVEPNNNKRKSTENSDTTPAPDKKTKTEWKWSREIKEALRSMEASSCKIKSLRKQVFKKAEEQGVDVLEKDEFLAKMKKVKKIVIDEEKSTVSL